MDAAHAQQQAPLEGLALAGDVRRARGLRHAQPLAVLREGEVAGDQAGDVRGVGQPAVRARPCAIEHAPGVLWRPAPGSSVRARAGGLATRLASARRSPELWHQAIVCQVAVPRTRAQQLLAVHADLSGTELLLSPECSRLRSVASSSIAEGTPSSWLRGLAASSDRAASRERNVQQRPA